MKRQLRHDAKAAGRETRQAPLPGLLQGAVEAAEEPEAAKSSSPPAHAGNRESPDLAAVIASQRGDEEAFEGLLTKYHALLYKIALRKTNNREDTEDICQEIAFHAFRSLPALREPQAFLGWLIALAHNRANRFCRTRQRRGRTLDEARDNERVRAARDQRTLARGEKPGEAPTNEPVRQIVASLPDEYRLALSWKYLEGLTYEVIGERLKMSFHQVDYLLRKAKRALRDAMPAP